MNLELKNSKSVSENLDMFLNNFSLNQEFLSVLLAGSIDTNYDTHLARLDKMLMFSAVEEPLKNRQGATLPPPTETMLVQSTKDKLQQVKKQVSARLANHFLQAFSTPRLLRDLLSLLKRKENASLIEFLSRHAPAMASQVEQECLKAVWQSASSFVNSVYDKLQNEHFAASTSNFVPLFVATKATDENQVLPVFLNVKSTLFHNSDFDNLLEEVKRSCQNFGLAVHYDVGGENSELTEALERSQKQVAGRRGVVEFFISFMSNSVYYSVLSPTYELFDVFQGRKGTIELVLTVFLLTSMLALDAISSTLRNFLANRWETSSQQVLVLCSKVASIIFDKVKQLVASSDDFVGLQMTKHACAKIQKNVQSSKLDDLKGLLLQIGQLIEKQIRNLVSRLTVSFYKNVETEGRLVEYLPESIYSTKHTERFTLFLLVTSCLQENSIASSDSLDLPQLWQDFLDFLLVLKSEASRLKIMKTKKTETIFMINNLQVIYKSIVEFTATGNKHEELKARIEEQLLNYRDSFAEEELAEVFGKIISFLTTHERDDELKINFEEANGIIKDFNKSWRSGLKIISTAVDTYFLDEKILLLRQVFTQLLLYTSRFSELLTQQPLSDDDKSSKDLEPLVSVSEIMKLIKKYDSKPK